MTDRVIGKGELEDLEDWRRLEASGIDREVKMGSYSANYLSYILLENNNLTRLGTTIRMTVRERKCYYENKEVSV